ncbi:Transcriptional regulator (fragment) [uncultured delta proteobacterium]|uniref:Transcriptional regulator n=1 Tax=uncultured delta proteobacterium TaxID=34034 RepID=A0A212IYF4_9DELT
MKFSPNTRYAIRVLFELGGLSEPVSTAYLAEKTGMSLRTVENIHAVLRRENITAGTVGAKGGIQLLQPLADISLGTLVYLFDDGVEFAVCCGDKSNECPNQAECGIRSVWKTVSSTVQSQLDAISLDAILQQYPTESHGIVLNKFHPEDAVAIKGLKK